MNKETWMVHCLHAGTGRALIGVADSLKNANTLYKEMCREISMNTSLPGDFVKTVKKIKELNRVVMDLT